MVPGLLFAASAILVAQPYADVLDVVQSEGGTPHILLLLDNSNSMRFNDRGKEIPECSWFLGTSGDPQPFAINSSAHMLPLEMLLATLVGCRSADDGILDEYDGVAEFSLQLFPKKQTRYPGSTTLVDPFETTTSVLHESLSTYFRTTNGTTPITQGMVDATRYIDEYLAANHADLNTCDRFDILLMTDGRWYGQQTTAIDYEACESVSQSAVTPIASDVVCSTGQFTNNGSADNQTVLDQELLPEGNICACGADRSCKRTDADEFAGWIYNNDWSCELAGPQQITTHVIGFGVGQNPDINGRIAKNGGNGQHISVAPQGSSQSGIDDLDQLHDAFDAILSGIVDDTRVSFSAPSISSDGFFSGNTAFVDSFQPLNRQPWAGNIKSYCILPLGGGLQYDTARRDCLFYSTDGEDLVANTAPEDIWTRRVNALDPDRVSAEVTKGGSGKILEKFVRDNADYARNLKGYRAGGGGYRDFIPESVDSNGVGGVDLEMSMEEGVNLVNYLNGYAYGAKVDGRPLDDKYAESPLGDGAHSGTVLLRYGDCEAEGNCYLVHGTNRGVLHIVDAYNGEETSALVMKDLFRNDGVANEHLQDVYTRARAGDSHRYYLDGQIRLFHKDTNSDLLIGAGEDAYLIFGLGRGGSSLYSIAVDEMSDGLLSTVDTPIRELNSRTTGFGDMQDQWHAPWLGFLQYMDGDDIEKADVGVFVSGHSRTTDEAGVSLPKAIPQDRKRTFTVVGKDCDDAIEFGASQADRLARCRVYHCGATGQNDPTQSCVDDTDTYDDEDAEVEVFTFHVPGAWRMRLKFAPMPGGDLIDLQSGDAITVLDAEGRRYGRYVGAGARDPSVVGWAPTTPQMWVYGDTITVHFEHNGTNTGSHAGFAVETVDYSGHVSSTPPLSKPSVYVVDLEKWNDPANDFRPAPISTVFPGGLIQRCDADVCGDDRTFMTCPISSRPSVVTQNGFLDKVYFADECGQIFRAKWNRTAFSVTRLLAPYYDPADLAKLAGPVTTSPTSPVLGTSKNVRKIFTRVQPVLASCNSEPSIALYFGTGDIQRPLLQDGLKGGPVISGPIGSSPDPDTGGDIYGVVFDNGSNANLSLADLEDITNQPARTALGDKGWYVRLEQDNGSADPASRTNHEKVIKDMVIFGGEVFVKTFTVADPGGTCTPGAGRSRIYTLDYCTGEGTNSGATPQAQRFRQDGSNGLGSEITLITPRSGGPVITTFTGDPLSEQDARNQFIYSWRRNR